MPRCAAILRDLPAKQVGLSPIIWPGNLNVPRLQHASTLFANVSALIGNSPRPSHDSRPLFRSARVRVARDDSEFHRPKTYVAVRRQTRKLPGESRMLSGGAGEIHRFFSDRIVNGRPPPERRVALSWLGSKLDNAALWESGTGPTLKNRGPSAFSTSTISRQLFERRDGISVPMAAQAVRLPQPPALALF
jgi:hypothetical protein